MLQRKRTCLTLHILLGNVIINNTIMKGMISDGKNVSDD